jgi:hypothetical protein
MMAPLFFIAPLTYLTLKTAAAIRHEICRPLLGTHAQGRAMRLVYPI